MGAATTAVGSLLIAPSAAAAVVDTKGQLSTALAAYVKSRGGTVGLSVYDLRNGSTYSWNSYRNETLSTVKVLILITLLKQKQSAGGLLSSSQRRMATLMLRNSDNAATDSLLKQVGGAAAVQQTATALGMRNTVVRGGSTGWWGYSTTIPGDLVLMMNSLVFGSYLNGMSRVIARSLMASVTESQRWGVAQPVPAGVHTEVKNGWGPMSGGYRLNSVGFVSGQGREYTMAILTRSPNGFSYGRTTANGVGSIVFRALDKPLI